MAVINNMFESPVDFSLYVENQALLTHSSCLETLIRIIEECDFDVEKVKPMLSGSLLDKLKQDYVELGMLPREKNILEF
jgi:cell division ATPase FtsA